jgi:hypothetical protein
MIPGYGNLTMPEIAFLLAEDIFERGVKERRLKSKD